MENWLMPHDHGNREKRQLREQLSRGEDFAAVAEVFRLLDDSTRLRIFWLLCHCEECVLNLSFMLDMSSPAVSHHLRQLKEAGLVESRREGREVYYRASDTAAVRLLHGAIEKVMEISCPESAEGEHVHGRYSAEQVETVRRMHDELVAHPEKRLTIEELARKYLMNPTTLKEVFKAVYGDSLAGHMKEHRLERAAELLRRGEGSVSEIAAAVGYDSPSRFSAAFRERFHMLPTEYRKHYE